MASSKIEAFVEFLKGRDNYKDQICHTEIIPGRKAKFGSLEKPLSEKISLFLNKNGFQLYSHQTQAIDLIREGNNVIITTPTASGKSLIFNISIFEALSADESATALYLYPTKALANDQLKSIQELDEFLEIDTKPAVYDGDTPDRDKRSIRKKSRIVVSNPHAFHKYLDWHSKWSRFFQNLRYVVVDEAHVFRGVFGSNCAQLFRRLRRISKYYGTEPLFILSSATIANPFELATKLIGLENFHVVSEDGSTSGRKMFAFWNPPFRGKNRISRRSPHQETRELLVEHIRSGLQTLCFTLSRRTAELIAKWVAEDLEKEGLNPKNVASYRAGYLPEERRLIEKSLRESTLRAAVSTDALELGVDIGGLDAVVISGYPGSIISTWQQAGRSGRGEDESLATLVLFEDPLQQYYAIHPERFFGKTPEHAIVDLRNLYILMGHLLCATAELPLTRDDLESFWGKGFEGVMASLEADYLVREESPGWSFLGEKRPADLVDLSGSFENNIRVLEKDRLVETLSIPQAYREAHEGAILLHQGETFLVTDLDLDRGIAEVTKVKVNYYTEALKRTDITILKTLTEKVDGIPVHLSEVKVTEKFYGYRIKTYDEVLGFEELEMPDLVFETVSLWFSLPEDILDELTSMRRDLHGAVHALEHALIAMTPMMAMCDRYDIGGISYHYYPKTGLPTVFIYDVFKGGIGISEKTWTLFRTLIKATYELVKDCSCEYDGGCPSCIQSPKCGNENSPLDKDAALFCLEKIVEKFSNV